MLYKLKYSIVCIRIIMLISFSLIFLLGILFGHIFNKLRLPSLLGMLVLGILLGPNCLNLIDSKILSMSSELRQMALVIILTRAGLNLNIKELKSLGLAPILMCFIPATFEIIGTVLIAPKLLQVNILEATIIGCVIAAVSPAIIVPRMINIIENNYGTNKKIPQIILIGASVDDIFVIVLFSSFVSLASGDAVTLNNFISIPIAILTGVVGGILIGSILVKFFKKISMNNTYKLIITLSISFFILGFEKIIESVLPFSGLLCIMFIGIIFFKLSPKITESLKEKYAKLWIVAEILLFVLVGANFDIKYALYNGINAIILLFLVLIFRIIGVYISLLFTNLNLKEKLFCIIAYIPKATVQASIGGIPLSFGLDCGNIVLSIAVLSIIIMAPLGAFGIDLAYKKLLSKDS